MGVEEVAVVLEAISMAGVVVETESMRVVGVTTVAAGARLAV